MPFVTGPVTVTPPTDSGSGTTTTPPVVVVPAPGGLYVPEWIAPDGTVLALNPPDGVWHTLDAVGGIGAAPVDFVTTANPDGGVNVEYVRPKESTIQWPLRFRDDNHLTLLGAFRQVTASITMTRRRGPGLLRLTRPDGTAREILAYYSSGLEGDTGGDGLWLEASPVINFYCPRPFWRDVNPTVVYREQQTSSSFLSPYMTVSSGAVFGATTMVNAGVTDVWPQWQVRGPMSSLTATNTTRGESFTITHSLSAGQVLTINSRPIQVRGPSGENLINSMNLPAGKPWRLDAESTSDVTFTVTGAAPAGSGNLATGVTATFYTEYETA